MSKMPYTLFHEKIENLTINNLQILENITEGWFVEYKREVSNASTIAKSISAFANTYGGWIFYGLEEKKDEYGKKIGAFSQPKIPSENINRLESRIDSAVKSHISPTPYFERKTLIDSNNKAIIIIFVPEGNNAPYIHSSGKLYRRVNEQSDPSEEKDRVVFERLLQRSQTYRQYLSDFLNEKFNKSDINLQQTYLHCYFLPDPLNHKEHHSKIEIYDFKELLNKKYSDEDYWFSGIFEIPFKINNIFSTTDGFIARHSLTIDPTSLSFTWRYYENCSSIVTIPIPTCAISQNREIINFLKGYQNSPEFINMLQSLKSNSCRIIDISWIHWILTNVIKKYRHILLANNCKESFYAKARIENIYQCIPFIDCNRYLPFISEYGLPIIQDNETTTPVGLTLESLIYFPSLNENDYLSRHNKEDKKIICGLNFFEHICKGLGVPQFVIPNEVSTISKLISRAQQVHQSRNSFFD